METGNEDISNTECNPWGLTHEERQILEYRRQGHDSKKISELLGISGNGVNKRMSAVFARLTERGSIPPDCANIYSVTVLFSEFYPSSSESE